MGCHHLAVIFTNSKRTDRCPEIRPIAMNSSISGSIDMTDNRTAEISFFFCNERMLVLTPNVFNIKIIEHLRNWHPNGPEGVNVKREMWQGHAESTVNYLCEMWLDGSGCAIGFLRQLFSCSSSGLRMSTLTSLSNSTLCSDADHLCPNMLLHCLSIQNSSHSCCSGPEIPT